MLLLKIDQLEKFAKHLESQGKDTTFIKAEIKKLNEQKKTSQSTTKSDRRQMFFDRKSGNLHLYSYGEIGEDDFKGLESK